MAARHLGVVCDERLRVVAPLRALSLRCFALGRPALGFLALGLVGFRAVAFPTAAFAVDIPLTPETVLRFAEPREAIAALTQRDAYIKNMSPFDRQVRPGTDRDVSEEELLAFMAAHVLPWTDDDLRRLAPQVQELAKKVEPWKLKLPPVVLMVKTDGREEGGAAYCRGAAIVLPQNMISGDPVKMSQILPHELFHVLSNQNADLREALYATIGFQPCNEVELPPGLRERKITNPDAPVNNHYITVKHEGRDIELMPVLFSKSPRYDAARGGTLFNYLTFRLLQVENDGSGRRRPVLANGEPVLLDPANVPDFHEQIGRNTKYIIHPEEVLADNFVFLLNGRINLPSPKVVEGMGRVLQAAAEQ